MLIKIWHKFFLLAMLGFLPILSHAQSCDQGTGLNLQEAPKTTPFSGGWKTVARFSTAIRVTECVILPVQLTIVRGTEPDNYSKNGVSVDIKTAKISLANSANCRVGGNGGNGPQFFCNNLPQQVDVIVEYTLTGKSTTTNPNIVLFPVQLVSFIGGSSFSSASTRINVNVPVSTAPTCSFSIDQANVSLQSIKPADIENLPAGTAVASVQKNVNITANCVASTLSANATFAPQFSPTKSAVLTGSSHVALNDGTDNGVGFKLFDPSGAAITFNTPLSAFSQSLYVVTPALPTVTKAFTIKYAKTSQAVKPGPASSSITVTFSII